MTADALHVYVADHLAGSATGVSLARRLARRFRGCAAEREFADLARDVEVDRVTLLELARSLGMGDRPGRQVAGWLVAQGSRVKSALHATHERDLGLFFELETMALGILGKLSLWQALHAAGGEGSPGAVRLPDLEMRARQQHALVERHRLDLARSLFGRDGAAHASPV